MTFFTVPISNQLPWQTFRITLSGVVYTLEFRYNTRMARWLMNINDAAGNPILEGVPCLILRDMIAQYRTLAAPLGTFFCTDDTGLDQQPAEFSFGVSNTLWYEDPTQ